MPRHPLICRKTTVTAIALTLPLSLALAGCGSQNQADDVEVPTDGEAISLASPIDEFTNLVLGTNLSPEVQIQQQQQIRASVEEHIAECMADAGFEYIPNPNQVTFTFNEGNTRYPNDPQWLSEWGFGGVRDIGVEEGTLQTVQGGVGIVDPNQEIRRELSPAELDAYNEMLSPRNPFSFEDEAEQYEEWNQSWMDRGCIGQAWRLAVAESPAGLSGNDEFAPLFEAIDRFRNGLVFTTTEADRDWAVCMRNEGYANWDMRPNFQSYFQNEHYRISTEIANRPGAQFARFPLWPEDAPEVQELFDAEVAIALVDLDCRNSNDFDSRRRAEIIRLESQFVDDNRDAFEALKAAVEQLG